MSFKAANHRPEQLAEPTWEIARLFPDQGAWSEEEYLALETNHLVEFSHGNVEVLPMPTEKQQFIVAYLFRMLYDFAVLHSLGIVLPAALRIRLWPGKYREPDIVFMLTEHSHLRHNEFWDGADLVMEIVSGSAKDRERDLVTKPREYAAAGIPEYWIVDPQNESITLLYLQDEHYREVGVFQRGETVSSVLLPGFAVAVSSVLDNS